MSRANVTELIDALGKAQSLVAFALSHVNEDPAVDFLVDLPRTETVVLNNGREVKVTISE